MKNYCLCCGKEIPVGLFQSSSCMSCIKAGCTGVAFYTTDGTPRWCKVQDKPAVEWKDVNAAKDSAEPM
jgi:hypothetical protein